jgi:hypothetical protein
MPPSPGYTSSPQQTYPQSQHMQHYTPAQTQGQSTLTQKLYQSLQHVLVTKDRPSSYIGYKEENISGHCMTMCRFLSTLLMF